MTVEYCLYNVILSEYKFYCIMSDYCIEFDIFYTYFLLDSTR